MIENDSASGMVGIKRGGKFGSREGWSAISLDQGGEGGT